MIEMDYPEHREYLIDSMNRFRTQSLFKETARKYDRNGKPVIPNPLWTLRDHDDELPSLKRLYIECMDPTEYTVALRAFGSWKHWQRLKGQAWFCEHVEDWSIELEAAMKSDALRKIYEASKGGKSAYSASKWLAEAGYKEVRRGRPTKEEVQRERKVAAALQENLEDDAERIGLTLVTADKSATATKEDTSVAS